MATATSDINDLAQEVADCLFQGGTVADIYGVDADDLEPLYAHGVSLYNQARWSEALQVFSYLAYHSHLEPRFHVARGHCLQMMKQFEGALRACGAAYVLDATNPVVCLNIAENFIALGKKDEARSVLEAVAAMTEGNAVYEQTAKRGAALSALIGH